MSNTLLLKWGTFKGLEGNDPLIRAAYEKYVETGLHSASAMLQRDSDEQKKTLCELIDVVDAAGGEIISDWSGETLTAEAAKDYVLTYRA